MLVALAVLVVVVISAAGAIQLSSRAASKAVGKVQAAFLLEEAVEGVRQLRDISWSSKIDSLALDTPYCLDYGWHLPALHNMSQNILLLHMNEKPVVTGATIVDTSGAGNHGTFQGDGVDKSITGTTSPRFGNAISFDGVDDYIDVPLAADPPGAYTIEAWVKFNDLSNQLQNIIVRTDSAGPTLNYFYQIRTITSSGNVVFTHYVSGVTFVTGITPLVAGQWYHVVATAQNGGQMRLYVNGVEEGTPAAMGTIPTSGDRYYLGSNAGSGFGTTYHLNGAVDELAIYHRVLSSTEILDKYRSGPPCQRLDNKFDRKLYFSNACRDSNDDIVASTTSGGTCPSGTENLGTKKGYAKVKWGAYSEALEFYVANIFQN